MEVVLSMLEYTQKELNNAVKELVISIHKGKETDILCWRTKIETYQKFITYLIDISSRSSQGELTHQIEMLIEEKIILQNNYNGICKLLDDAQKEIKKLTDKLCNIYR